MKTDPIPQITRQDEAAGSGDLVGNNVARLKALFPEIVTDGKIDFDVLRELLGEDVEESEERYGLNWKGKRRARAFALTPSLGTLRPAPADSINWETTQNIFVEGDNLEVLKLLRRSYAQSVKLIYIDPPYNTGNDFVYRDNYKNPIGNYLSKTGQSGDDNEILTSDAESGGRFHSDWLTMIYPRLILAKELLRSDGVIFINIGDEELYHLTQVAKEIFGEENFLATIAWQKKYGVSADSKGIPLMQDYIIALQRSDDFQPGLLPRTEKQEALYSNDDNDPRGPWTSGDLLRNEYREKDRYEIVSPSGKRHRPPVGASWRHPQEQIERMIAEDRVWFGSDGNGVPRVKRFLSETKQGVVISGWWPHTEAGHNDEAKKEVKRLLEDDVFQTPKPIRLLKRIFQTASVMDDDIVLDFFAGSGTTAHALMQFNAEFNHQARSITVQLPETLDAEVKEQRLAALFADKIQKPRNIAELTKERVRRAGSKVLEENPDAKVDIGFRVYKLATSNLKPWQPDADDLEASILDAVDNVLPGRTEDDLLVELLLKTGVDLTLPEEKRIIGDHTVHALGGGTLMVCLGDITAKEAEALGEGIANWVDELDPVQTTVYFKDTGLGADGNRAATKANLAAILRQRLGDRIAKIASI